MRITTLLCLMTTLAHACPVVAPPRVQLGRNEGLWFAEATCTWHRRPCPTDVPDDRAVALPLGCTSPDAVYAHSVVLTKVLVRERAESSVLLPRLRAELVLSRESCDTQTQVLRATLGDATAAFSNLEADLLTIDKAHRTDLQRQRKQHDEEKWAIIRTSMFIGGIAAVVAGAAGFAAGAR